MSVELTGQFIGAIVGFLWSYIVEQTPLSKAWKQVEYKPAIVNLTGAIVAAALVGLHYAGAPVAGIEGPFGWDVVFYTVGQWVLFVTSSQGAYNLQKDNLPRRQ